MSSHRRPARPRLDPIDTLYELLGPPRLRFCPLTPTARQEAFLLLDTSEVFFGGAAAGGKTAALLMAAVQYCDVPGYHALLVRRSLTELSLPGNLIDLSHDWFAGSKARWNGDLHQWRFPGPGRGGSGGGSLTFGYLADAGDPQRYAGTSFSFLGFDELTAFPATLYRRLRRVLRQPTALTAGAPATDGTRLGDVPVRLRAASNPGGPHNEWVKERFVDPASRAPGVIFLPSRLADNPHIDPAYADTLAALPPAERERLLNGDWEIPDDGELFRREWLPRLEPAQVPAGTTVARYWDLAGSERTPANPDPDYTVGLRLELHRSSGVFYVTDVVRERLAPGAVERLVVETARRDGPRVQIVLEQEPGAAGKAIMNRFTRVLLRGYSVHGHRPSGAKELRARPVAACAQNGLLRLIRGRNSAAFLDELTAFPHGRHDDCVDALAGAHHILSRGGRSYVPQLASGRIATESPASHRIDSQPSSPEELAQRLGAYLWPRPPR